MKEAGGELHYWDAFWDLSLHDCPCDRDFVDWLDQQGIVDSAIYHFGTGGHHHVGIACASPDRRNAVLGITASPQEYEAFFKLAIAQPKVLRHYNAVFGDIYLLNPKLLPLFDVVTLFHLCEFRGDKNDAYGALTDRQVLDTLAERTRPGGHILFFPRSFAFSRAEPIIESWASDTKAQRAADFRTLRVYRTRGEPGHVRPSPSVIPGLRAAENPEPITTSDAQTSDNGSARLDPSRLWVPGSAARPRNDANIRLSAARNSSKRGAA